MTAANFAAAAIRPRISTLPAGAESITSRQMTTIIELGRVNSMRLMAVVGLVLSFGCISAAESPSNYQSYHAAYGSIPIQSSWPNTTKHFGGVFRKQVPCDAARRTRAASITTRRSEIASTDAASSTGASTPTQSLRFISTISWIAENRSPADDKQFLTCAISRKGFRAPGESK